MKVIALTGMPGSGKTVVIDALKSDGYETLYMGNVVRSEMKAQNIPLTSKNVRNFASEFRKKHGDDIVAQKCLPELKEKLGKSDERPVIIEDIKGIAEVEYFRSELGTDFVLIAIHTPPQLRFERSQNRQGEWDDKTTKDFDEFKWRDSKEMSWGLSEAIALADHVVTNDSDEAALLKKIKDIIEK